jgi:PPIC-type PPIASE domain.
MITLILGTAFTTGCSKSGPSKTLVVTVGNDKIYMDEMMYYIYTVETTGAYYDNLYKQNLGSSYWDIEQDGKTMRDTAKEYIMYTAVMYDIMYDKAMAAGDYDLTADELKKNETSADQLLSNLSKDQLKITGFTKKSLLKTMKKITIGEKYYNKIIDDLKLDKDAIKKTVDKDKYRQYNTEYLFAATTSYDTNSNIVNLSKDEQAAALASINSALEKVKSGKTFEDIAKDDTTLKTSTRNFVYGDGTAETEYQDAAIKLNKDEYSTDVIKTAYGYYIIKMDDNNATDSYDKAVDSAVQSKETEGFNTEYEKIKKDYTITTEDKIWDAIVIGSTTIVNTSTTEEPTKGATQSSIEESTKDVSTSDIYQSSDTTDGAATNSTDANSTESK